MRDRARLVDLIGIALVGWLVVAVAPPLAGARLGETITYALAGGACERCFRFAFDFSVYVLGAQAWAEGVAPWTVQGYIYPSVLARFLHPLLELAGGDGARLTAWHGLLSLTLWPALAVLASWSFRRRATRWIVAAMVFATFAFREAVQLGNADFEVLLLLLLSYRLHRAGRTVVPGVLIGLTVAVKPTAVLIPWAIAVAAAVRGWRAGELRAVRGDALLVAVSAVVCGGLWLLDLQQNVGFFAGGAMEDIAGRCRGVGVGTLLRAFGASCPGAVRGSLLLGIGGVAAWAAWRADRETAWAASGLAQPIANALTSAYAYGYALFAWVPALEELERVADEREPTLPDLLPVALVGLLIVGTNFSRVGLGSPVIGSAAAVVAVGVVAATLRSGRDRAQPGTRE